MPFDEGFQYSVCHKTQQSPLIRTDLIQWYNYVTCLTVFKCLMLESLVGLRCEQSFPMAFFFFFNWSISILRRDRDVSDRHWKRIVTRRAGGCGGTSKSQWRTEVVALDKPSHEAAEASLVLKSLILCSNSIYRWETWGITRVSNFLEIVWVIRTRVQAP